MTCPICGSDAESFDDTSLYHCLACDEDFDEDELDEDELDEDGELL